MRDVPPDYPPDARARGIQGVVIIELIVDQAGIPVTAYALRPVEGLTMAAVKAALQWRYQPDANYERRVFTVTVNVALGSGSSPGVVPHAAPSPASAQAPVRVGGNIPQPKKIRHAAGVLPDDARQAGIQGVVILEIIIGPTGKVQDAKILRSIPLLDQAALEAVRQWEYEPTLLNGTAVPVIMTVTVPFY